MPQDDLFPYCLSLFQASRYVEGGEAMEEQAFALLEQIQEQVAASPHPLQVARWGLPAASIVAPRLGGRR